MTLMHGYAVDPILAAGVRGCFALLFGAAAVHKIRRIHEFVDTLTAYRILPTGLTSSFAAAVPILELSVALGLLVSRTHRAAGCAGSLLLVVYAAAMGLNLLRRRTELHCGCYVAGRGGTISWGLVIRNLVMACLLGTVALLPVGGRPLVWVDVLTCVGGAGATAMLYAATSALIESGRLLKRVAE